MHDRMQRQSLENPCYFARPEDKNVEYTGHIETIDHKSMYDPGEHYYFIYADTHKKVPQEDLNVEFASEAEGVAFRHFTKNRTRMHPTKNYIPITSEDNHKVDSEDQGEAYVSKDKYVFKLYQNADDVKLWDNNPMSVGMIKNKEIICIKKHDPTISVLM